MMSIIANFSKAMEEKDHVALSNCFADRCRLFDYCPSVIGKENFFIYGSRAVDMFYHNKFVLGGLQAYDPVITDERTVNFYCKYGDSTIHALATIASYDPKSGLIKELVIRPA